MSHLADINGFVMGQIASIIYTNELASIIICQGSFWAYRQKYDNHFHFRVDRLQHIYFCTMCINTYTIIPTYQWNVNAYFTVIQASSRRPSAANI